jgi:hypothetical protein
MRNELNDLSEPEETGGDQNNSGAQRGDQQPVIAMFGDNIEDDDDKCSHRPANLYS